MRAEHAYELEFFLFRLLHICLLAKKALAFKSISFSFLRRATSLRSFLLSSATWNGFWFVDTFDLIAPPASLSHFRSVDASTPKSRATSAAVASLCLSNSTAFCLNSGVYLFYDMSVSLSSVAFILKRDLKCQPIWGRFRFSRPDLLLLEHTPSAASEGG